MDLVLRQWRGLVMGVTVGVCIAYSFQSLNMQKWDGDISSSIECNAGNSANSLCRKTSIVNASEKPVIASMATRKIGGNSGGKRIELLLALWEASSSLSMRSTDDPLLNAYEISPSDAPRAPHLEKCETRSIVNQRLDEWGENGTSPPWSVWKGERFGLKLGTVGVEFLGEDMASITEHTTTGYFPPWIQGADEDNLPLTRKVQQDIWHHQHPRSCQQPDVRFLLVDWETDPGFGMGAQIASMAGMLAIAVNEKRVLVSNYFNRADHGGCAGKDRALWSCYFLSETSKECRNQALLLANQSSAWRQGVITSKNNYSSRKIWKGKTPTYWGKPWELMQPTTEIDRALLVRHKASDRRWWRAQAVRYFMRFRSKYMCLLLNYARHIAFGVKAAQMVLESLPSTWPEGMLIENEREIDRFVWEVYEPWIPRPLLSMHVRQGDKAREMKVVDFNGYMKLAHHLRHRFPHTRSIWLSTEMQEVIDESKQYSKWWDIYFTNVSRQSKNTSMASYEASLGRELSTNYPLVNFLLAADADFFVGALGSTWCYLIDGMRTTGGRVMSGYLSVNRYRFW